MDASQIILIVFIGLLIIAYPILITTRNKKQNQKLQEQTNSLKRGDKVLTTSGVYGTIVDLQMESDKKIVTIETGTDKKKGYISVDAYAIYTVFSETKEDDKTTPAEAKPAQPAGQTATQTETAKPENKTEQKPQPKQESKPEQTKQSQPAPKPEQKPKHSEKIKKSAK